MISSRQETEHVSGYIQDVFHIFQENTLYGFAFIFIYAYAF